jgi:hypothetical protein
MRDELTEFARQRFGAGRGDRREFAKELLSRAQKRGRTPDDLRLALQHLAPSVKHSSNAIQALEPLLASAHDMESVTGFRAQAREHVAASGMWDDSDPHPYDWDMTSTFLRGTVPARESLEMFRSLLRTYGVDGYQMWSRAMGAGLDLPGVTRRFPADLVDRARSRQVSVATLAQWAITENYSPDHIRRALESSNAGNSDYQIKALIHQYFTEDAEARRKAEFVKLVAQDGATTA